MNVAAPLDMFGNEVEAGDTIVYPNRFSSSMWLTAAEVVEVGYEIVRQFPQEVVKPWARVRRTTEVDSYGTRAEFEIKEDGREDAGKAPKVVTLRSFPRVVIVAKARRGESGAVQ